MVTLGVLLAVLGAGSALVVLLGDGGGSNGEALLKVEQAVTPDGGVEILVTVPTDINVAETARGQTTVIFECLDSGGQVVIRSRQGWPLVSDGNPPAPHVHQPATPEEVSGLSTCRFRDTDPKLEGRVGLGR